ncbi:MAG: YdeI family protein [Salibacteraceae bacterium]
MLSNDQFPKITIKSADELRQWLLAHHTQAGSVWLVTYKKAKPTWYVSTSEVLDELLCFGWMDGIRRKLDDDKTMQLIAPRKAKHWSKTYKDRAARLIENGRMQEAGHRSIAESKASGLWDFLDDVDQLIVPDDLKKALAQKAGASDFFNAINPSSKRFALRWLKLAKTQATREKRLEKLAVLSASGEKLPGS